MITIPCFINLASDDADSFRMDVSQFDIYGMEPQLTGEFKKVSDSNGTECKPDKPGYSCPTTYWKHTSNEIYVFVNDAGDRWFFTTELGKPGTFLGLKYTETGCPADEEKLWTGFWDEVALKWNGIIDENPNMDIWNGVRPRKDNTFIFKNLTLGPIEPTPAPTTPAPPSTTTGIVYSTHSRTVTKNDKNSPGIFNVLGYFFENLKKKNRKM